MKLAKMMVVFYPPDRVSKNLKSTSKSNMVLQDGELTENDEASLSISKRKKQRLRIKEYSRRLPVFVGDTRTAKKVYMFRLAGKRIVGMLTWRLCIPP